jgi:hypothetical protein
MAHPPGVGVGAVRVPPIKIPAAAKPTDEPI